MLTFFSSVYCNSLLATLNVRNSIREKGHNDLGISLRGISDSNASTVDNHQVAGLVVRVASPFSPPLLTVFLTQEIKAEVVEYTADVETGGADAHDRNRCPSLVQSTSVTTSLAAEIEPELESGRTRRG